MNNKDKEYYEEVKTSVQLLDANWNAMKQNPPCERNISELITYLKNTLHRWDNRIKIDDMHYAQVREIKKKENSININI